MAISRIIKGTKLRLRDRIVSGHPVARLDERVTHRSDMLPGMLAEVLGSHGTQIQLKVMTDPNRFDVGGTEIWVDLHNIELLFTDAASQADTARGKR